MTRDPAQSPVVSPAHKSLGKRLRTLRIEKGLTQGDIEKRSGLLRGHISRLEYGHITPSLDTLRRFAEAIEVPLYFIFYTEPSRPGAPSEIPEDALKQILDLGGEPASQQEAIFLKRLKRLSARLTDADRELLLMMAEKVAETK